MGKPDQFKQDLDRSIRSYPVVVDGMGKIGVHNGIEWESPGTAWPICCWVASEMQVPRLTLYTQWCLYAPNFVEYDSMNTLDHSVAVDIIFWIAEWLKESKQIWPPDHAYRVKKPGALEFKPDVPHEFAEPLLWNAHHYFSVPKTENPRYHVLIDPKLPDIPLAVAMVSDNYNNVAKIDRLFAWFSLPHHTDGHLLKMVASHECGKRGIENISILADPNLPTGNWAMKAAGYKQRMTYETRYTYLAWDSDTDLSHRFGLRTGFVPSEEITAHFGTGNLIEIEQTHGLRFQESYARLLDSQVWSKLTRSKRKQRAESKAS